MKYLPVKLITKQEPELLKGFFVSKTGVVYISKIKIKNLIK